MNNNFQLNGSPVSLPYAFSQDLITIEKVVVNSLNQLVLTTKCGLVVKFTTASIRSRVDVNVIQNFAGDGNMWGLCGDCDGEEEGFILPDRTNVTKNNRSKDSKLERWPMQIMSPRRYRPSA